MTCIERLMMQTTHNWYNDFQCVRLKIHICWLPGPRQLPTVASSSIYLPGWQAVIIFFKSTWAPLSDLDPNTTELNWDPLTLSLVQQLEIIWEILSKIEQSYPRPPIHSRHPHLGPPELLRKIEQILGGSKLPIHSRHPHLGPPCLKKS